MRLWARLIRGDQQSCNICTRMSLAKDIVSTRWMQPHAGRQNHTRGASVKSDVAFHGRDVAFHGRPVCRCTEKNPRDPPRDRLPASRGYSHLPRSSRSINERARGKRTSTPSHDSWHRIRTATGARWRENTAGCANRQSQFTGASSPAEVRAKMYDVLAIAPGCSVSHSAVYFWSGLLRAP